MVIYLVWRTARAQLCVHREASILKTPSNARNAIRIALNVNHQLTFAHHVLIRDYSLLMALASAKTNVNQ